MVAPDAGDIIWINFSPQRGREQAGKRPALILTSKIYNNTTGLALACPITTKIKGYPFEVRICGAKIDGAILVDQIKCLDWRARHCDFAETAPTETLSQAKLLLARLLAIS
ncbi:MAG: endoribonuclease MazF [Candidatus Saccharimonadales bacterium]